MVGEKGRGGGGLKGLRDMGGMERPLCVGEKGEVEGLKGAEGTWGLSGEGRGGGAW